jgi:hypothetical protein
MRALKAITFLLASWLTIGGGCALAAGVQLSLQAQQYLGLTTQKLSVSHKTSEIDAFAKVLDPAPLVQADSDLRTAEAAAAASKAEAERSQALHAGGGGVSAKDAEAALAQAKSDALHVDVLRRQIALAWGPGVARLSASQRERLVRGLTAGSTALVHVDTHNNEGQTGATTVRIDIGDKSLTGRVIGPARIAEPRLQSSGLIVEITGRDAVLLSVGLIQSAHIASTTAEAGVTIPRSAVVRYEGSDWAYVRTGPSSFERRLIQNPIPTANGYFVSHGFASGQDVVIKGAAAVFAAEQAHTRAE